MITKQLFTYTQKVERANQIISLREDRIQKNLEAINIIDSCIEAYINEGDLSGKTIDTLTKKLKIKELQLKRIDFFESNLDNSIQLRIQKEILREDMAAKERFEKIKSTLEAEISSGKWDECVEAIKEIALNIKRKNKNADTSRYTNAVAKSFEDFETDDERLDHFKILKDLSGNK